MKKGLKIVALILITLIMRNVYAEEGEWTTINIEYGGQDAKSELWYLQNGDWGTWADYTDTSQNPYRECDGREDCYEQAINYFSTLNKQYYTMFVGIYPPTNGITLFIIPFDFTTEDLMTQYVYTSGGNNISHYHFSTGNSNLGLEGIKAIVLSGISDPDYNNFYLYYDGNFNFSNDGNYAFSGFYSDETENGVEDKLKIYNEGNLPKIKDLIEYNSWSDYESNHTEGYTEINLDNYEYVLLSLKNYNQTEAFQTNLQVKGQIGITPIYNYGQTSKDSITGVQVQDRCNVNYENYTSYPFYIIQTDLQNNVVYAVKECSQGSSFKFDNNIFDITYVTAENVDNPTITIGDKTYNVIPYEDLPSTATKNEEEGYIPGESGSASDTGGLDSAIKNVQQRMSEIWNTFTYFTDFVGQIFSSMPSEVQTVLLSTFTIALVLGLIKIFIN